MAQPGAFVPRMVDERSSSGVNKNKRPDSGIHNSTELNGDPDQEEANQSNEDFVDSGQESDMLDSSVNTSGTSGKKKGFLKNFKKMFKKKKSSKPEKAGKNKNKDKNLREQTKTLSEPDGLAVTSTNNHQFKRTNTQAPKSPQRTKPPRSFPVKTSASDDTQIESEDETNIEKRSSVKDGAQQYIRSSLRKLKGKRSKGDSEGKTTPSPPPDEPNMSLDDKFFSTTHAKDERKQTKSVPLKLGNIETTAPKIQTNAAKDRIRIAPQNRRKPSRYRTGSEASPNKPTRTSSVHSFNNDSSLGKIDEDTDNFTSVSRNSSGIGARKPSYNRQESQGSSNNNDSRESLSDSRKMSEPSVTRIIKKSSFKTKDDSEEPREDRTAPQRSLSSNSRENVNRPKPPIKPPRSTHTSTSSLHKEDSEPSRGFSLDALNGDYPGDNKSKDKRHMYSAEYGLSSSMNHQNTPLNEINENTSIRKHNLSKDGSITSNDSNDRIVKSTEVLSTKSKGDVVAMEEILRKSKEDLSSRNREEYVSSRSIQDILRRGKDDVSRSSKEDISRTSKEDISRTSKEDVSRSSKEDVSRSSKDISRTSKEDVSRSSKDISRTSKEDLFRSKNEDISRRYSEDFSRRSKEDISRSSKEDISRRYTEDFSRRSKEDISRRYTEDVSRRSKEDISRKNKEDISRKSNTSLNKYSDKVGSSGSVELFSNNEHELVFPKTDGMMAFALTTPHVVEDEEKTPFFYRSKSCSENNYNNTDSKEHLNEFRERSRTSGAKSHGNINEVGIVSPPPVKQKPYPSPRKLRRPTSPEKEKLEVEVKTPEFNRISLKKVPKLDDYSYPPEGIKPQNESEFSSSTSVSSTEAKTTVSMEKKGKPTETTECKEKEIVKPFKLPDLRSSDMFHHTAKKQTFELVNDSQNTTDNSEHKVESSRDEFLMKRHSLKKIDPLINVLDKEQDSSATPVVLHTATCYQTPELKRASWKNLEEKTPTENTSDQTPVEWKRNSLKKVERTTFEIKDEHYSLPNEQNSKITAEPLNDEKPPEVAPRALGKGLSTVKSSFKFQSKDILPRSKSLSSSEVKNRNLPPGESKENVPDGEPEWFKLARRKQKTEEDYGNIGDSNPFKKEQKIENKPSPPPTKPKVSPRPVVSPKPVVSPRPKDLKSPPTPQKSFKMSVATPPTRTGRNLNGASDIPKNECIVCKKIAYTFEKVDVNGRTLHKTCARCVQCDRELNVGDIFIVSEKVYCSQHK